MCPGVLPVFSRCHPSNVAGHMLLLLEQPNEFDYHAMYIVGHVATRSGFKDCVYKPCLHGVQLVCTKHIIRMLEVIGSWCVS